MPRATGESRARDLRRLRDAPRRRPLPGAAVSASWGDRGRPDSATPSSAAGGQRNSERRLRRGVEDRASPRTRWLGAVQPRTPSPEDQRRGEGRLPVRRPQDNRGAPTRPSTAGFQGPADGGRPGLRHSFIDSRRAAQLGAAPPQGRRGSSGLASAVARRRPAPNAFPRGPAPWRGAAARPAAARQPRRADPAAAVSASRCARRDRCGSRPAPRRGARSTPSP